MTRTRATQRPAELDIALRLRLAMDAHRQSKFTDAERAYGAILEAAPDCFEALHFLGLAYLQQNKLPEALDLVSRALKSKPQSIDSLAMRGIVLSSLGRHAEALETHDTLLALRPQSAETHYNRGVSLAKLGQHEEAVASYRKSIALKANNPQVFYNLGNSLIELDRLQEAMQSYDMALAISPDHLEVLNNRACLLGDVGRTEEALANYDRVLEIDPRHAEAWIGRGHMLVDLHREEEGIESYQQAQAVVPHHPDAGHNEGINRLRLGDFKRGWEQYELRWSAKDYTHTQREYPLPRWNGDAVDGPLLVSGEQGLGDQILFASMLPDLAARVSQITVEVEPRLIPLFARSFPGVNVVAQDAQLYDGPVAAHTHMGSLGRYLRSDWESFPVRENGYLRCDSELSAQLRKRLSDGRKLIGLSWSSRNPRYERSKSARLLDFAALLRLPDCRFIDLQYGDTRVARETVQHDLGITVERLADVDNLNDIDALASLIAACDIVVTVSNTTAHLAGALGKETYVLVPSGRGRMWCWFRERDDSPFYPRMHLKRQRPKQHWSELTGAIAAEIAAR